MLRRTLISASLLALPSLLAAQGSARSKATQTTEMMTQTESAPSLREREVEDASPLHLLIDKRKDLKLTDDQLKALKDRDAKLRDADGPILKTIDDLLRASRTEGTPTDQDRARVKTAQTALRTALDSVRTIYDAAAKDGLAGLSAEQQAQASPWLSKQRDDATKDWHERMVPKGGDKS